MKKIILMLVLGLTCFTTISFGQRITKHMVAYTGAGTAATGGRDTTSGADTTYFYLGSSAGSSSTIGTSLQNGDGSIAYGADVVYSWSAVPSITGTTTGTIYIQGSETGTFATYTTSLASQDWVALTADVTQFGGGYNTVSVTSSVKKGYFVFTNCQFKYVRLVYITSGTQTSTVTVNATILNPPGGD
jgi:hypothetical protein